MHRQKGIPNTPQSIIDEIVTKHPQWSSIKSLSAEYGKPFKTIKNTHLLSNTVSYTPFEGKSGADIITASGSGRLK